MKRRLLGYRNSQESIGMSFGMIFSIILIIFFLIAAFVAIKYFLNYQEEIQMRTYFSSFQEKVNDLWSSGGIVANEKVFGESNTLPSGITNLCYLDFSSSSYSGISEDVTKCDNIKRNLGVKNANFAFYSPGYDNVLKDKILKRAGWKIIEHINSESLPDMSSNCYCLPIENGKIKITISTSTENPIVRIGPV
jgi:hypothetical protein